MSDDNNRLPISPANKKNDYEGFGEQSHESTPLLQGPEARPVPRPSSSALILPHTETQSAMRRVSSYGTQLPGSWSNYFRPSPYTDDNKPNRRPFHIPRTSSNFHGGGSSFHGAGSSGEGGFSYTGPPVDYTSTDEPSEVEAGGGDSRPGSGGPSRRTSTVTDPHSQLYTRYRYYSRLRAPAEADDHALVIPDHVVPIHLLLPYIPGSQTVGADGKQASFVTIISIWNTMMGTSLLTMPWAFGKAGFAGGLLIMLAMAGICLFTAYRILTVQRVAGLSGPLLEASSLCRYVVGGVMGRAVEGGAVLFSILTLLGALVVYWVLMTNFLFNTGQVIHDSIYPSGVTDNTNSTLGILCPANFTSGNVSSVLNSTVSELWAGDEPLVGETYFEMFWDQHLTVPFFLLLLFVPLLCIKNTRIFSYFNSLGAVSVLAIYLFVVVKSFTWGINMTFWDPEDPLYVPLIKGEFMALSGTLSLAYFIHNCIITIMKGNRVQENNVRDLTIAYMMVMGTYIPIGVLFYIAFPLPKFCLADNFLDNFPPHAIVLAVVRVFLLFQMVTVFPLLCVFLRTQLICYCRGPSASPPSALVTAAVNCGLLTCCVLVAVLYPNVGFLIRWVGAFAGLVYVFMLPCGLYMKALYTKGQLTVLAVLGHGFIILVGVANFVAQFFL